VGLRDLVVHMSVGSAESDEGVRNDARFRMGKALFRSAVIFTPTYNLTAMNTDTARPAAPVCAPPMFAHLPIPGPSLWQRSLLTP
jgi:hypothetical protein